MTKLQSGRGLRFIETWLKYLVTRLEIDEPEHCKYLLLSHLVPVTHRFVICAAESLHVHALIRTSEDPRT